MNDEILMKGHVKIVLKGPDGKIKLTRKGPNVFTDTGDAHVADQLASSQDESAMSHMAIGTGTTAALTSDTVLDTELDRNALTSFTQGAGANDNDIIYVGDWAAGDGTGTITEAGIFNDVSTGTMMTRQVFSAINKGAGDTLQITWTITIG